MSQCFKADGATYCYSTDVCHDTGSGTVCNFNMTGQDSSSSGTISTMALEKPMDKTVLEALGGAFLALICVVALIMVAALIVAFVKSLMRVWEIGRAVERTENLVRLLVEDMHARKADKEDDA